MRHFSIATTLVLQLCLAARLSAQDCPSVIDGGYVKTITGESPYSEGKAKRYVTLAVHTRLEDEQPSRYIYINMYRADHTQLVAKAFEALERKVKISWQFDCTVEAETIAKIWIAGESTPPVKQGCCPQPTVCVPCYYTWRRRCR